MFELKCIIFSFSFPLRIKLKATPHEQFIYQIISRAERLGPNLNETSIINCLSDIQSCILVNRTLALFRRHLSGSWLRCLQTIILKLARALIQMRARERKRTREMEVGEKNPKQNQEH